MGGGHEKKQSGCKTAWQIEILAEAPRTQNIASFL